MTTRLDCAVILARGASRRMGSPKGLLPCPGAESETFVAKIAGDYRRLGIGGVVVCPEDLVGAYASALVDVVGFSVVGGPTGGETGQTLQLGWYALGTGPTHLWAQPVDLPLVMPRTRKQLLRVSTAQPGRVVRPVCGNEPGHPVIVPVETMAALAVHGTWQEAPVREVLDLGRRSGRIAALVPVSVTDSGVVRDFDRPGDLRRG